MIQDYLVVGVLNKSHRRFHPKGEFGSPNLFGGKKPLINERPDKLVERMFCTIGRLVQEVAVPHHKANYARGALKKERKNHISRLITNEFYFYTEKPLILKYFQALMQKVFELARKQPENLHLILGSFAVLTDDNEVMNVVPQIECGPNPKLNFTVKNNTAAGDPNFTVGMMGELATVLKNVRANNSNLLKIFIKINNEDFQFSFDNVFLCQTAGGVKFYSCIDICIDHQHGLALKNINARLALEAKEFPIYCSHVVLSNSIKLLPAHFLVDITHVDPKFSIEDNRFQEMKTIPVTTFGTDFTLIVKSPIPCSNLPLHLATQHGKLELVRKLLEEGAHVNRERDGKTSLHIALEMGYYDIVIALLENGADADILVNKKSGLHLAAEDGHLKAVETLVKHGVNSSREDNNGMTPLMYALEKNHIEIVDFLLGIGVDINQRTRDGSTALSVRVRSWEQENQLENIKYLIKKGASPSLSKKDKGGRTPLMWAIDFSNREIAQFLLNEVGKKINETDPITWKKEDNFVFANAVLSASPDNCRHLSQWLVQRGLLTLPLVQNLIRCEFPNENREISENFGIFLNTSLGIEDGKAWWLNAQEKIFCIEQLKQALNCCPLEHLHFFKNVLIGKPSLPNTLIFDYECVHPECGNWGRALYEVFLDIDEKKCEKICSIIKDESMSFYDYMNVEANLKDANIFNLAIFDRYFRAKLKTLEIEIPTFIQVFETREHYRLETLKMIFNVIKPKLYLNSGGILQESDLKSIFEFFSSNGNKLPDLAKKNDQFQIENKPVTSILGNAGLFNSRSGSAKGKNPANAVLADFAYNPLFKNIK